MDGWICGMMDGRMDRCMDRGGRNGSEEYMNKSMPQEHIFQLFLIRTFIKCVCGLNICKVCLVSCFLQNYIYLNVQKYFINYPRHCSSNKTHN